MYYHTDDNATIEFIMNVASLALQNGQPLRLDVDDSGRLRLKRGGGIWSPPIDSTFDMSRDVQHVTIVSGLGTRRVVVTLDVPVENTLADVEADLRHYFAGVVSVEEATIVRHCGHDACQQHKACVYH